MLTVVAGVGILVLLMACWIAAVILLDWGRIVLNKIRNRHSRVDRPSATRPAPPHG